MCNAIRHNISIDVLFIGLNRLILRFDVVLMW
jgi:hypothetical protein